ncbi:MAG: hypothetical protein ACRCS9_14960, partial [Hyphomicrobium sp.]
MSIEALMSAVDAAGYVMVADDDLPESFGSEAAAPVTARAQISAAQPSMALSVWQPVLAAAEHKSPMQNHVANFWGWVTSRMAT